MGRGARLPRARRGRPDAIAGAVDLAAAFDLGAYTRHVDTVFDRLHALTEETVHV